MSMHVVVVNTNVSQYFFRASSGPTSQMQTHSSSQPYHFEVSMGFIESQFVVNRRLSTDSTAYLSSLAYKTFWSFLFRICSLRA